MREKKSPFIIYPYFESILVRKHYGKKNLKEINTKKHQKHIAFSHDYKLVSVDVLIFLKHTSAKMLFTILLIIQSKKINIVMK